MKYLTALHHSILGKVWGVGITAGTGNLWEIKMRANSAGEWIKLG